MQYKVRSVKGKKSQTNEDNFSLPFGKGLLIKQPDFQKFGFLFLVCDGMGGNRAGEVASRLCAKWFWEEYYFKHSSTTDIFQRLGKVITDVNIHLFYHAAENPDFLGMGTTLVGVLIKSGYAYFFNVGDSRAYICAIGELQQITEDDSEIWDLYRKGLIKKDEILTNRRKNFITEAMATKPAIKYHLYDPIKLPEHYTILLCSDGLHDVLVDAQIAEILDRDRSSKKKCELLIKKAIELDSRDDITVIVVED